MNVFFILLAYTVFVLSRRTVLVSMVDNVVVLFFVFPSSRWSQKHYVLWWSVSVCVRVCAVGHAASGLPSTSSYWPCHVNETTFRCNYFSVKLVCSCTYYCSCCSQKLSLTKPFEVENLYILDVEQVTKGVLFLWHLQLFSALIRQILSLVRLIKIGDLYQPSSCKKILKSLVACCWNCTGKYSGAALMMSV